MASFGYCGHVLGLLALLPLVWGVSVAADPKIARDDAFPDPAGTKHYAGELILVEHVNRMGILRLDRDGTINSYHWDLPHHFQMLPYGSIAYHGAPAALEDVPVGTHLHGQFYLGPEGDYTPKVPDSGYTAGKMADPDMRSVVSKYSLVIRLEDDFSYHRRRGEGWKLTALGKDLKSLTVERVSLADATPIPAAKANDGIKSPQVLRLDRDARVWKGHGYGALEDLEVGQILQINFTWVSLLGSAKQDGMMREVWIDAEGQRIAAELQRQTHLAHMKRRGLPAIILKTESMPGEGARGHITFAFADGVDPELLAAFGPKTPAMIWAAEPSLRVYDALNDVKHGDNLEITKIENPPPGHSGVQVRLHCWEMIEGYRAGRTIRVALKDWAPPERPREELLWPNDTRKFQVGPNPVSDREGASPLVTDP